MPSRNVKGRLLRWQISYDKRVARLLNWKAKLLYTWIIPSLDNLGRIEGEPRLIRSMILPLENLTDKQVAVLLEQIHKGGLLFWYNINGERYLQCPTIEKNIFFRVGEGRNRVSDYPPPPKKDYEDWVVQTRQDVARHVGVDLDKDMDIDKGVIKDKTKYLDFVLLTKEELKKLYAELGEKTTKDLIIRLNNYIGSKGKKYKSHYHTILSWVDKDKPQSKIAYRKLEDG